MTTDRIIEKTIVRNSGVNGLPLEMLGGVLGRNAEGQIIFPVPDTETTVTQIPFGRRV